MYELWVGTNIFDYGGKHISSREKRTNKKYNSNFKLVSSARWAKIWQACIVRRTFYFFRTELFFTDARWTTTAYDIYWLQRFDDADIFKILLYAKMMASNAICEMRIRIFDVVYYETIEFLKFKMVETRWLRILVTMCVTTM